MIILKRENENGSWNLEEGILTSVLSAITFGVISKNIIKNMVLNSEMKRVFKQSNLHHGDKVSRSETDSFGRIRKFEGKIIIKNNNVYVAITKGISGVGTLVLWDASWQKL